jgi:hypothetical protein
VIQMLIKVPKGTVVNGGRLVISGFRNDYYFVRWW